MSKKWSLRQYKMGDEEGILAIRKAVFPDVEPEKMCLSFWNWEFKGNPIGPATISVAYLNDSDLIIGHYAGLRTCFKVFDSYAEAALGCDSMTMPGHRYPWMFLSLMEHSFNEMKKNGVLFHYGFPYRQGIPELSKASGMKDIFDVPILVRPINFTNLCNRYIANTAISKVCGFLARAGYNILFAIKRYKQQKNITIEKISSFDSSFNLLWERVSEQFNIIQKRDKPFLEWKFTSNPAKQYQIYKTNIDGEITGYAVTCNAELFGLKCLIICDVIAEDFDKDSLKALSLSVLENAHAENVDLIGLMLNEDNPYYKFFTSEGYIKSKFGFKYTMISFCKKFDITELKSKDFYLTWADADTM